MGLGALMGALRGKGTYVRNGGAGRGRPLERGLPDIVDLCRIGQLFLPIGRGSETEEAEREGDKVESALTSFLLEGAGEGEG